MKSIRRSVGQLQQIWKTSQKVDQTKRTEESSRNNVILVTITIAANFSETFAMKRTYNAGGACNVVWDIDRDFTVNYFASKF